jgi:hypothetical protein
LNVAGELFAIIVNLGAVAGNLQFCFESVKALGVLLRVLVCIKSLRSLRLEVKDSVIVQEHII